MLSFYLDGLMGESAGARGQRLGFVPGSLPRTPRIAA
jgi:hypothetical protein